MIDRAEYDPDWERRWARALQRLEALPPTASQRETRAALKAMHLAYDAQFKTVAELAAFRFGTLKRWAFRDGQMLAMQPLGPEATDADVDAAWRSADAQIMAAKRAGERPPLAQPEGLSAFGPTLAARTVRSVEWIDTRISSGRPEVWAAMIERRLRSADVCLVEIQPGRGVYTGFDALATLAYRQLHALGRRGLWPRPAPRRVQFYSYVPWGRHETGSEMLSARALSWRGGRYVENWERRKSFASVPLALGQLDPKPPAPHLVIPLMPVATGSERHPPKPDLR